MDLQEAGFSWHFPYGEKNVELVRRILGMVCDPGDIVLDSFAGSGTTGHAVLQLNKEDGGDRRFIMVEMEMETEIARTITAERLRRVIEGYTWTDQQGNERREAGLGGGFRYCALGATIFHPDGAISDAATWEDLARHIWFTETRNPWPGDPRSLQDSGGLGRTSWLGAFNGVAYYLYFNGIGSNVFGPAQLAELPIDEMPKVVYADMVAVQPAELAERKVTFKQIPYDVKVY
jgi:adenine-specific DNA-methyltransferase